MPRDVDMILTEAYGASLRYGHRHRCRSPGHPRHRGHRAHLADVLMGTDSTDAEGNYSVGSLPTGEYKVSFGGNANHLAGGTVTG